MGPIGKAVLALALAGAAASWVVGAVYYARCLAAIEGDRGWLRLRAAVAWPFTLGRLKGAAGDQAAVVNKAIVAFFVCLTIAVAAISLSTNYARFSK